MAVQQRMWLCPWSTADKEALAACVQEKSTLYNHRLSSYKDTGARENAWNNIGAVLGRTGKNHGLLR